MLVGSLDQWAVKFWVSFVRPNCCTNDHECAQTEARSLPVAASNLPFALISLFLGVVLNFPLNC